jgi:hypothetical protein
MRSRLKTVSFRFWGSWHFYLNAGDASLIPMQGKPESLLHTLMIKSVVGLGLT